MYLFRKRKDETVGEKLRKDETMGQKTHDIETPI